MADRNIEKVTPTSSKHTKLPLRISEGFRNLGLVNNKQIKWGRLVEKMFDTVRDNITSAQYEALSRKDKHERKNNGWFVGGQFKDGKRKIVNIESRSLLTYDCDESSIELYQELLKPFDNFLAEFEYFLYTTRSHTPEKPRFRLVIPLSREITSSEFTATSRIVGYQIQPDMEQIDHVSFRVTQLMFWPTTSKDGNFETHWNGGRLLDPDEVLTAWPNDWRDVSRLPRSPRETKAVHETVTKAADPRAKRGIIGAWCRAHTISDIIGEWLSDRYALGDQQQDGVQRWTYLPGSSTNGMVVYDNDTFAWSNHGTDPGADQNLNPWDFMRVHQFGHLDKTDGIYDDDVGDVTKLPSYKAMTEFAHADAGTVAELQKANYDLEAMANDSHFDTEDDEPVENPSRPVEAGAQAPIQTDDKAWLEGLSMTKEGLIKSDLHNIILILENDIRFKGAFAYNEFVNETVVVRRIRSKHLRRDTGPLKDKSNGDTLTDVAVTLARSIIEAPRGEGQHGWGVKVAENNMWGAIYAVAYGNRFHPVRRYIEACDWDGVPRLRKMLRDYWNVVDNSYHEQVSYLMMVAAVARVYEPGHKFDFVPILEGRQGLLKSTSISVLAVDWFAEFHSRIGDVRAVVENIQGKWFVELPELVSLMDDRASVESLKALFSGQKDRTRMAYARAALDFPRQCIFIGTTNNREYLRDATGNRRYWIVELSNQPLRIKALRRDVSLLWAEAREEYLWFRRQPETRDKKIPLPLFLPKTERLYAEALQDSKMLATRADMRRGMVEVWLDTPVPASQAKPGWRREITDAFEEDDTETKLLRQRVCIADVIHGVFSELKHDRNLNAEIGRILTDLPGWKKHPSVLQRCGRAGTQRVWVRIEQTIEDDANENL